MKRYMYKSEMKFFSRIGTTRNTLNAKNTDILNKMYLSFIEIYLKNKEGSVLFNDAHNTFSYGYIVSDIW